MKVVLLSPDGGFLLSAFCQPSERGSHCQDEIERVRPVYITNLISTFAQITKRTGDCSSKPMKRELEVGSIIVSAYDCGEVVASAEEMVVEDIDADPSTSVSPSPSFAGFRILVIDSLSDMAEPLGRANHRSFLSSLAKKIGDAFPAYFMALPSDIREKFADLSSKKCTLSLGEDFDVNDVMRNEIDEEEETVDELFGFEGVVESIIKTVAQANM